jgi:uncharacterized protein YbjT (DUF2867 family)
MKKILVTGASGFIGKRLIYKLLEEDYEVYALLRTAQIKLPRPNLGVLNVIEGDLSDSNLIDKIPKDVDAAYFLVHAMSDKFEDLIDRELKLSENFLKSIESTNCKQIIFLSGIVEDEAKVSEHLRSRLMVEKRLHQSKIPCTTFRASIIIGSGSASFEMIRDLTEKLPVMVAPKWVMNFCQPIAIRDVLFYLTESLLNESCYHKVFDIGGPEAMRFKDVLLRYAAFRKLKRYIINVPVLTPKLSSYWLVFITSVKYSLCRHLVESMKQNSRKLNLEIDKILPHTCSTYEKALEMAFQKISQNEVISSWMDSWDLKKPIEDATVPCEGCLKDVQLVPILLPMDEVKKRIWTIGGNQGWYAMDWAWRLRGFFDKIIGGAGLNRGRRDPHELAVGDALDFWRVLLVDENKIHLILYAEMKLPGEAWLEFEVVDCGRNLKQTATFRPKGLLGHLYWYLMIPFHYFIFRNMANYIANQ